MQTNPKTLQILLVDDVQADLDVQRRTLQQCKIVNEVLSFKNGPDVLKFLLESKSNGAQPRFLIFLDLLMKPDDGTMVLRKVQEENLAEGSVIVMLSGLTDVKLLHEGYQLGANTFLVKPLKVQDVMELLATLNSIEVVSEEKGNRLVWS